MKLFNRPSAVVVQLILGFMGLLLSPTIALASTVSAPTFSVAGGTYPIVQNVSISTSTANASIRYTTDGSTPSSTAGTLIASAGSITISTTTTLKAIAYETGFTNSSVTTTTYTLKAAAPTFNPPAGPYSSIQTVSMATITPGATIWYSTNGNTPSPTAGTVYTIPITIDKTTTLKAVAYATGFANSAVAAATYTITLPTASGPAFYPPGGTFTSIPMVTLSTETPNASIRYLTNGSNPSATSGTLYTGPISVGTTTTFKAIAYETGYANSPVTTATYTIVLPTASAPKFQAGPGKYSTVQAVTITTSTGGASIRYTTDGSTPSSTAGTPIANSGSVTISGTTTLKAIAYETNYKNSTVTNGVYYCPPLAPVFSPAPGAYPNVNSLSVSITDATNGALSIYYTTDGTVPTTASTPYTQPVVLTVGATTFSAAAINANGSSTVFSGTYVLTPPLPDMPKIIAPSPLPAAPIGWDVFTPPVSPVTAIAGVPTVAEWARTGVSDDTLILTGDAFSNASGNAQGEDTQFLVFGQTAAGDAFQAQALIQRLDGQNAAITLPAGLPAWSTYFIWPKNSTGYGTPVAVNRTEAWWIGPDVAAGGDTVSVYGRNLSHSGGTTTSWVYIQQAGTAGQWASLVSASAANPDPVNPYQVQFTVPAALPNGTYQVWIHNGHGGSYGWSGPLTLSVKAPFAWDSDPLSIFNVRDYGAKGDGVTDDFNAINSAFSAASNYAYVNGYGALARPVTLYFPAGTYLLSQGIGLNSGFHFKGDGINTTFLKCNAGFLSPQSLTNPAGHNGLIFGNGGTLFNLEFSDLTLDSNDNFNPNAAGGTGDGSYLLSGGWSSCDNLCLRNVCITVDNPAVSCASFTASTHVSLSNCTFIGGEVFLYQGNQQEINDCIFDEANNEEEALRLWGISNVSITGCTAQDNDPSSLTGQGAGRFIAGNSQYGTQNGVYIGDNTTLALGPPGGGNSGEQVLCEGNYTQYEGGPTEATATTVTLGGLTLDSNSIYSVAGEPSMAAVIVNGKGLGQHRLITGYDGAQTITVNPAWNVIPDTSSTVLVSNIADKWVVSHNNFNGKASYDNAIANGSAPYTAQDGIEPYGGCYDWSGDGNTFSNMFSALSIIELSQDVGYSGSLIATMNPCYFNYYANNIINTSHEGLDRIRFFEPPIELVWKLG